MTRTALVRTDRYSKGAIGLHWAIAVLVILNLVLGLFHESLLHDEGVIPAHKAIGITVLMLTIARIGWRQMYRPPLLPPDIAGWERVAAKGAHAAFYILLIALPLSGWILASNPLRVRPLDWFGLFPIPLLPVSAASARLGGSVHGPLGWVTAALIVVHIGAALRHHFILRNAVLGRMAPGSIRNG